MIITRGMNVPATLQHGVVTIGNFDGVHIGHQIMLETVVKEAKALSTKSIVIVFEPHPQSFISGKQMPRLMTLREKANQIASFGIDALVVLHFNKALSEMTAAQFIQTFLREKLQVQKGVLGHDFRFGAGRKGDVNTLRDAGIDVVEIAPITFLNERVSSSTIREALSRHDLIRAEQLLGSRYNMQGKVIRGNRRGHQLGFPTANILPRRIPALQGVFAVTVKTNDGTMHPAVANLGTRPTVDGTRTLLEVHLLDGDRSLYGERLEVTFIQPIRHEQKFDSLEALKAQIAKDIEAAKQVL